MAGLSEGGNEPPDNGDVQYVNNVSVKGIGIEGKVRRVSTEFKAMTNPFPYNSLSRLIRSRAQTCRKSGGVSRHNACADEGNVEDPQRLPRMSDPGNLVKKSERRSLESLKMSGKGELDTTVKWNVHKGITHFSVKVVFKLPSIEGIAQLAPSYYGVSATVKKANIVSNNMCSFNNASN
ncbi:hypothetical protein ANN_08114 [Periplaneta americana]|uniref:Uncharacterized protein n=1 Tax=Periplaneta americana TaxID=6978 RepID=A0ABQ8T1W8_PERAM|nr:hypothetical protein ANN_08114 [Periplaneta americana]